jgi:nucleotide-binding universal stress UspA family protein
MTVTATGSRSTVGTEFPTIVVANDPTDLSEAAHRAASLLAEVNDVDLKGISAHVPPADIAEFAREQNARVVIVGMNSGEIPAKIAWPAHRPLLAVSPAMRALPHRIVIAMDLDPSQLGNFGSVLSLFGRASAITCLHVQVPENFPGSETPTFTRAYDRAISEAFDEISEAARNASGVDPVLVRSNGDPAEEIIRFATSSDAELIVLGLRRHFGRHQLEGGRVAREILRHAPCSVLVVPER